MARLPEGATWPHVDARAPDLDFGSVLVDDEFGLVLEYPGIAVPVA